MKRSPLKRKTPLTAKAGIQRQPMKRTSRRQTEARKASRGDVRWRSAEYLAWIRSLPCSCCQGPGGDPHHLIGMWGLSGAGLTAPDSYAMPLCRACHDAVHRSPEMQQAQPEWLRLTLERAVAAFPGESALHAALVYSRPP